MKNSEISKNLDLWINFVLANDDVKTKTNLFNSMSEEERYEYLIENYGSDEDQI